MNKTEEIVLTYQRVGSHVAVARGVPLISNSWVSLGDAFLNDATWRRQFAEILSNNMENIKTLSSQHKISSPSLENLILQKLE